MHLFWKNLITFRNYSSSLWVQFLSLTPVVLSLTSRFKISMIQPWLQTWAFRILACCMLLEFLFLSTFCLQRHLKAVRIKQYCNFWIFVVALLLLIWIFGSAKLIFISDTFLNYVHICFLVWKIIFEDKIHKERPGLTMSEDKFIDISISIYRDIFYLT